MISKERKYKKNHSDVRVAIWEAYDHMNAYCKGEKIDFREMEVDHIIPQDMFKYHPDKVKQLMQEFELPEDFGMDCLRNYAPTRRLHNTQKGGDISSSFDKGQACCALREAERKEAVILKKIEEYNKEVDVITTAAKIASTAKDAKQKELAIDIILNDIDDFEERESIYSNNVDNTKNSTFSKATGKIWLHGYLPKFENMRPNCYLEFRTIKLRDCMVCVRGEDILKSCHQGLETSIEEELRRYIKKLDDDQYCIMFGDWCVYLDKNNTRQFAEVWDAYCSQYLDSILNAEREYDLEEFEVVNRDIRLFKLSYGRCLQIFRYIERYRSCADVNLEIHGNSIHILSRNDKLNAIITLHQSENYFWYNEPEYWFDLAPYYADRHVQDQEWWGPSKVRDWFAETLIPCIYEAYWTEESGILKRRNARKTRWEEQANTVKQILHSTGNDYQRIDVSEIKDMTRFQEVIIKLQSYYNMQSISGFKVAAGCNEAYELLELLLERIELKHGSYSYIGSKIGKLEGGTREGLLRNISQRKMELKERPNVSSAELDNIFRSIMECLRYATEELPYSSIIEMSSKLKYLIDVYNRGTIIDKYLK